MDTTIHNWTEFRHTMTRRECRHLRKHGRRDGRRAVLPDKGTTPAADLIHSQARAAVRHYAATLRKTRARLTVELAGVDTQIQAASQQYDTAQQAFDALIPHVDVAQLPERAVTGDTKLIQSLTVAKAAAKLRDDRGQASAQLHASRQHLDTLHTRRAELAQRVEELDPELREHARHVAAQADIRITFYSTALLRWHRHRERLRPLLPLTPASEQLDHLLTAPEHSDEPTTRPHAAAPSDLAGRQ